MKPFDPELLRRVPAARAPVSALSVAGVLGGALAVAQAVCLAWLASAVVTGADLSAPLTWTVALLVGRGVVSGAQEWLAGWAGQQVASGVRLQLLRRWSGLPEGARPDRDEAVTRATDGVAGIEPYVARYLPALVTAAVVPVLSLVTLLVIDVWAALIVVLTLPLLPVFAALIGKHTEDETRRRWAAMSDLAGHFLDVVRGLPTLVAYGRAERQVDVVAEVGRRHRVATVRTLRTAFLTTVALELLATISVALVAVCVGLRLAYGAMDLQVAMTAILLAPEAYWPIRRVGAEFHNAADGAEALDRLLPDLVPSPPTGAAPSPTERTGWRKITPPSAPGGAVSTPPSAPSGAVSTPPSAPDGERVVARGVTYHHPGRADTLRDLDLSTDTDPGLTALTGPSGAGKTTLLELLAGLRVPTAGTVHAPRAHLATQRPLLLPGTVRDNLTLGAPDVTEGEMTVALGRVGLWAALRDRHGLDTVLGDDGFGLSAGQRGRLALARALLSDAPLVLLDEPTAHIATGDLPAIRRLIVDLARHRRVVVATHDLGLAGLADQQWRVPLLHRTDAAPASPVPSCSAQMPSSALTPLTGDGVAPDAGDAVTAPADTRAATSAPPPEHTSYEPLQPADRTTWLRRWFPTPRARLRVAAVVGGLATASGVALTATSGWLIVQASYQPVVLTLLVAIVGVRAFGLARPVLRYAERVTSHDVALEVLAQERTGAYARLVPLTPARLGRRSRGDVLTAVVRDLDDVTDEKVRVVVPVWDTVLASVVAALVVGAFLPAAGVIVAAGAVLVLLLGRLDQALEQSAHHRLVAARGAVRRLTSLVTAQLPQVQAVTGLGGAEVVVDRVARAQRVEDSAARALSRSRGITVGLTWLVIAAAVGSVAWLAGGAFLAGSLTGPTAALVALTPMALADAWGAVPDIFGARARAHAARERLKALFDQEPAVAQERHAARSVAPESATPRARSGRGTQHDALGRGGGASVGSAPVLTTHGVKATWNPSAGGTADLGTPDLGATDLRVEPGDRVVLTGPNGVGKSTLLAVLARHLDPSAGSYRHDGVEVRELPLQQVRDQIALADDEPHAFTNTVRANLVLARPEATDEELVDALRTAELGHWFDQLPDGLDTRLTGLSGGERTRLSLARGILSGRPVLLLDEPTAHLDEVTATRVLERLGAAQQSAVMVSHDVRPRGWQEVVLTPPRRTPAASGSSRPDLTQTSARSR